MEAQSSANSFSDFKSLVREFCFCKGSAWSFSLALQREIKTLWQLGQYDALDNYQAPN